MSRIVAQCGYVLLGLVATLFVQFAMPNHEPLSTPSTNDISPLPTAPSCNWQSEAPHALVGFWRVPGNTKHKPSFFIRRLRIVAKAIAERQWPLSFNTDSTEARSVVESAYSSAYPNGTLMITETRREALPYSVQARSISQSCPTKYGRRMKIGALPVSYTHLTLPTTPYV